MDRIAMYPKPRHTALVVAFAHMNEMSKSESATYIIGRYFDSLPSDERDRLRKHYESMTREQRRNPKSY